MHIFGGKFHSTVRTPNQPDNVNIEDWRLLQLDIQVRFPLISPHVLVTYIETLRKGDSVYTIEDGLAQISHLQPVQLYPPSFSEGSQQVLIETLPPVLVLHLKRFLYDVAEDSIVKISKPVKFAPELQISSGMIFTFVTPV
jgi:ubiquitin carboxyl-terminal hydrolase 10